MSYDNGDKQPPGTVSIIIPAYNRQAYIRQTVESVLNQTYPHFELIVVDDGSSDGTRQVLESYGDRLTLLQHDGGVNRGQSASINLGLRHASGEFIAILDSDDYWELDKLQVQAAYLAHHPETGLVYANGTGVDHEGNFLYDIYPPGHIERNRPEDVLLNCYFLVPNNSLFRKSLLLKSGHFDENLRAAQDHDMAIRIAEITKLAYIDKPLFHYRRHSQSISHNSPHIRWRNGFIILDKARKRYPYSHRAIFGRKAVLHFRLYQCLLQQRSRLLALYHLLLAGIYNPIRAINVILGNERVSGPH